MPKQSHHNFKFDEPVSKEVPSIISRGADFILPVALAIAAVVIGHFWF